MRFSAKPMGSKGLVTRSVSKLSLVAMIVSALFPNGVSAATVAANKVTITSDGFVLSGSYSTVAGQPTGAGQFTNGNAGAYVEGSCLPGLAVVKNKSTSTGDISFDIAYDYKKNGNVTDAVGFQGLEGVTTALSGNPKTSVDNLNDLSFSQADLTNVTSFSSSLGTVNATITGPYSGGTGTAAITSTDFSRHETITLSNVQANESVYVLFCGRLGLDATQFPGSSLSISASGGGSIPVQGAQLIALPSLTITKVVSGGTATPDMWSFAVSPAINGTTTFAIPQGSNSVTIPNVQVDGTYTVTEQGGPADYQFTSGSGTNCSFSATGTASATLAAGNPETDASCTFTNTYVPPVLPTLTVNKVVVNENGGTNVVSDFPLFVDATSVTSGVSNVFEPGTYTVSETNLPGYTGTFSGDCDSNGLVVLAYGDSKVCTLTNDDLPATVTVRKIVVNDNGGTKVVSDFPLFIDGNAVISDATTTVAAGAHVVTETTDPGYVGTFSGDCDANGNVTAVIGESKVCILTNDDQPATLTVIKHVINNDTGTMTADNFTLNVTGSNVSQSSVVGSETGVDVTLDAGAYSVTENATAGYTTTYGAGCVGSIAPGEHKTCTVTNDDTPVTPPPTGSLTIIKHVVNDNGGTASAANFGLAVDQDGVNIDNVTGAEDPGVTIQIPAGNYAVSEIVDGAPTGYTATYSTDCTGSIADGEAKTCTVTNDDQSAQLTVIKTVTNTHGGTRVPSDFVMNVTGGSVSTPSFNGDAAGTTVTLDAGSYSVDESATLSDGQTANDYIKSLDAGCTGTLSLGQKATCTVTNSDPIPATSTTATGTIHVIKTVVNDNGGTKVPGDFTMHVTASNPSTNDFAGSASGTDVTVDVGAYSVDEGAHDGYTETLTAGCSGTMTAGATQDCTITNDDIASNGGGGGGFTATTGTINVIKHVINDNGGTHSAADFTMQVTATNPSQTSFAGSEQGVSVTVDAGSYSVDESSMVRIANTENSVPSDYTKTIGEGCSGSIAAGQTVTCTITNDDPAPKEEGGGRGTLIIKTFVVNTNGGLRSSSDFVTTVTGSGISATTTQGDAAGVSVTLDAGAYSITQAAAFGYTQTLTTDCSGSIAAGQTKTCEITEKDPSTNSQGGNGGGGGGGGGGVVPSGPGVDGGSSGGSSGGAPSPAPRVLGEEFTNLLAGACPVTEMEAPLITPNTDDLVRPLGQNRDTALEQQYLNSLVPRVLPTSTEPDIRMQVANFTTYGTRSILHLGAGERAGVVNSFRAVFGRAPKSICDWQMALRIAKSLLPAELNPAREKMMEGIFTQIWKRAPDRTKPVDDLAVLIMTYGLRPLIRDLPAERRAIRIYRRIFRRTPNDATSWDTMRAIAYSTEPTP